MKQKKFKYSGTEYFYVRAPEPGDTRPRNAFGMLKGFGEAYDAYYAKKDAEALKPKRKTK